MDTPPKSPEMRARNDSFQSGLGVPLGSTTSGSEEDVSRSMKISIQLEANSLPNLDRTGKSDPFTLVYRKVDAVANAPQGKEEWVKVGQTETVYNNLNPKWATTFSMEYRFGSNFVLKFLIYDRDSTDDDLRKHDYIGEVRCTVAQIVLADNQCLVLQVNNPKARPGGRASYLTIRGEEEKGDLGDSVTFQFAVTGLRRGRKPFYVLSRKNRNDNEYSPVMYSEVHQSYNGAHQVTTFRPTTKSLQKLVNGDMDRELRIQFLDYDRRGNHYRGGCATFTLRSLNGTMSTAGARYNLKKIKSNGQVVDAGTLIVRKCEVSLPYSFLDYIQAGTVINLVVAVDMSATNGNPADPSSLQYNDRNHPNEYVIALREVGNVLAAYDTSKTFPAFGFGAALPPSFSEVAHVFALTGNIMQPVCNGVDGVIDMYYNALSNVAPYEPCKYGPMLDHVIKMTRDSQGRDRRTMYTVLLLITDGDFTDFSDVANLICSAADLPLSIVIVGVGNSHFVQLEQLDGDDVKLCSTDGTPCARDIVQFVQFHKHRFNPAQLAKEVLDEIPDQLVSYMRSKGIKPNDIVPHSSVQHQNPAMSGGGNGPLIPTTATGVSQGGSIMQPRPQGPMIPVMPTATLHQPGGIQTPVPPSPGTAGSVGMGMTHSLSHSISPGMSIGMQPGMPPGMHTGMQPGMQPGMPGPPPPPGPAQPPPPPNMPYPYPGHQQPPPYPTYATYPPHPQGMGATAYAPQPGLQEHGGQYSHQSMQHQPSYGQVQYPPQPQ